MFETITDMIKEIVGNSDVNIVPGSSLKEDIGMNSYEKVQLMGLIEDKFDISISMRQMKKFDKVQDIVDFMQV